MPLTISQMQEVFIRLRLMLEYFRFVLDPENTEKYLMGTKKV